MNISWVLPSDLLLECIDFNISTNASVLSPTTNSSSAIITRPVEDPADAIYTVTIAAVDRAGRTGEQSETRCFSFECENNRVVYSCDMHFLPYAYMYIASRIQDVDSDNTSICSSAMLTIQWTVKV